MKAQAECVHHAPATVAAIAADWPIICMTNSDRYRSSRRSLGMPGLRRAPSTGKVEIASIRPKQPRLVVEPRQRPGQSAVIAIRTAARPRPTHQAVDTNSGFRPSGCRITAGSMPRSVNHSRVSITA